MTPEQLDIVSRSASQACADRRGFATRFYDHLFASAPAVRPLFPDDMSGQYDKLVDEVAFLAGAATDLDSFLGRAKELGRRHHGYGATADHFGPVEEALLVALGQSIGDDWSGEHEQAWRALYRLVAEVMLDGVNEALFQ
jgi:hemoglobin-like flavoprotein